MASLLQRRGIDTGVGPEGGKRRGRKKGEDRRPLVKLVGKDEKGTLYGSRTARNRQGKKGATQGKEEKESQPGRERSSTQQHGGRGKKNVIDFAKRSRQQIKGRTAYLRVYLWRQEKGGAQEGTANKDGNGFVEDLGP